MAAPDLRSRLRAVLGRDPIVEPGPGERLAAVLALLVDDDDPEIVFTERSAGLSRHAGEVSFPGGLQEPGDGSLRATALRECAEEIGLDPAAAEVVGSLPPLHTFVSDILVVPFVALLERLPVFVPSDDEIARVITVRRSALLAAERAVTWVRPGEERWTGWIYEVGDATIWGATGRMLHDLLGALRGVTT